MHVAAIFRRSDAKVIFSNREKAELGIEKTELGIAPLFLAGFQRVRDFLEITSDGVII